MPRTMFRFLFFVFFWIILMALPGFANNQDRRQAPSSQGAAPNTSTLKVRVVRAKSKGQRLIIKLKDGSLIRGKVIGFTDKWFMVNDETPFKGTRIASVDYVDVESIDLQSGPGVVLNDVGIRALRVMKKGGSYAAISIVAPFVIPIAVISAILGHPIVKD